MASMLQATVSKHLHFQLSKLAAWAPQCNPVMTGWDGIISPREQNKRTRQRALYKISLHGAWPAACRSLLLSSSSGGALNPVPAPTVSARTGLSFAPRMLPRD